MIQRYPTQSERTIPAWSFSALKTWEECPYRSKLARIDKVPELPRPAPESGGEHANDRGTRIHNQSEFYVKGKRDTFPAEMKEFTVEMNRLREMYKDGIVLLEDTWAFNDAWESIPADQFKLIWIRIQIDVFVFLSPVEAVVIDYKGLPLDTMLPTPTGWTTMADVKEGDQLLNAQGTPCTVTGKSEKKRLPCYKITFDDQTSVICDEEHLWATSTGEVKKVTELDTTDLIPTAMPLELPKQNLPLDPYVLGVWLGDGEHTSGEITNPDDDIWQEIQNRGFNISHNYSDLAQNDKCRVHTVYGLRTHIKELGILGAKRIPYRYMRASFKQRLDLLRGIMDTDGSANKLRNQAVLITIDEAFAKQVNELTLSLGQRSKIFPYTATGFGKEAQAYQVVFRPNGINPFKLKRKAEKANLFPGPGRAWRRRVTNVQKTKQVTTQCLMVDSPDHTFLCTENFIPTHNTGKRFGNEVKHAEQTQLYQLAALMRFPDLEIVHTEVWYPDVKELHRTTYKAKVGKRFFRGFNERGLAMTSCKNFKPKPNAHSCMFCPFGPKESSNKWVNKNGACRYGV